MKFVKWDEYTKLLDKLFDDVQMKTFDNILAIGRGGSIIAAYLSSRMGIPTFCPAFVRHVGRGAEMKIVVNDFCQIDSLRGKLLVVDDWLCDGRAMNFVLNKIPQGTTITTLVMYCNRGSEFKPDFVGEFVEEEEREIMFPYDALG
ncbi:phosphoribosyltransferase [Candidatus Bathyarchaeota archaeon]|nr:phosphoribosyltransferase [Candidatus Bathyarchaeota archaeon]